MHAKKAAEQELMRLFGDLCCEVQLNLYDYRNRTYSAELGRFIETDPIRFKAKDENLYRYVSNNPVNWVDPMGLAVEPTLDGVRCLAAALTGLGHQLAYDWAMLFSDDPPNDKYMHCLVSCRMQKVANDDETCAKIIGDAQELLSQNAQDSIGDQKANAFGRKAAACKDKSCAEACNEKYPR